jgi:putative phosphoesterase
MPQMQDCFRGDQVRVKIAIVSDVHGNLDALEAVLEDLAAVQPDLVIHGGDLAFNGPQPVECIDRIRELGWPGVLGNTDQALWAIPETLPENTIRTFEAIAAVTTSWLGPERVAWLKTLPLVWRDQDRVALVHAVPGDTWKVVDAGADDEELRQVYGPLQASLAVYCHIHRPYIRRLDGFTVANSGSVGMPFDGDPRAAYLVVEDGTPVIRRVAYDVERHVAHLERSGIPTSRWLIELARTATPSAIAFNA